MRFQPGQSKPERSGRQKGTPNEVSRAMREVWREAFERKGGIDYLLTLPDELFVRGLLKMIPNEVTASLDSPTVIHRIDIGPKPSPGSKVDDDRGL